MDDEINNRLKHLGLMAKEQQLNRAKQVLEKKQKQAQDVNFARMMSDVRPLKPSNQYQHPRDTTPIWRRRQENEGLSDEDYFYVGYDQQTVPPARFSKNGRGVDDIRRLQTKYWPIVACVDLHGYNQEQAQQVLNEFIHYVQQRGVVGEVIHGSGLGSKDYEPVLKNLVRHWLIAHPKVIAYTQPHERNDGAVYILVKKRWSV